MPFMVKQLISTTLIHHEEHEVHEEYITKAFISVFFVVKEY